MSNEIEVKCPFCHGTGRDIVSGKPCDWYGVGGCKDHSGYVEMTVEEAQRELLRVQINKLRSGRLG